MILLTMMMMMMMIQSVHGDDCSINCSSASKSNTSITQTIQVTNVGYSDLVFSNTGHCQGVNVSTCTIAPDAPSQITNVIMPQANCVDGKSDVKLKIDLCVPETEETERYRFFRKPVQLFTSSEPISSPVGSTACKIPANSVPLSISPNCSSPALPWPKTLMVNDTACLISRGDQDCSELKLSTASWCDGSIGVCKLCNSPFVTGCKIGSCFGGTCTECDGKFYQQRKGDVSSGVLLGCYATCPSGLYEDLTNNPSRPGLWCISKCPANSYNTTTKVMMRNKRTRKLMMTSISSCMPCDEMCLGCDGPGPSKCQKCKHVKSTDGICIQECLAYEYNENGECEKYSELVVFTTHLYVVGTVSMLVCFVTCLFYCNNKWHLQRHPGPLVMNKMLYDMILCSVLIAQSVSDSMPGQHDLCHGVMSRRFSAWVLQFSLLGSELTYLALCYDLKANLMNPFREVRSATRNLRILIFLVSLAAGIIVMILTEKGVVSINTIASFGEICWLDPSNQLAYVFLLYLPLGVIYTLGIYFTVISAISLRGALPKAQRVWSAVFRQQSVFILGFSAYWIMFGLLIVLQPIVEKKFGEQGVIFVSFLMNFFLGARGTLTVLLWIRVVYRDDTLMHTNLVRSKSLARAIARTLSFGGDVDFPQNTAGSISSGPESNNNNTIPLVSGGATTEDEDRRQDLNLQPHLNVALRQELLYFTRLGILHSIRKFRKLNRNDINNNNVRRSHSSRYLLRRDFPASFTFDGMSPTNTMSAKLMRPSPISTSLKQPRKRRAGKNVLSWLGSSFPFSFGGDDEGELGLSDDDVLEEEEEEEEDVLEEEQHEWVFWWCCCRSRKKVATFPIVFTDYFRHTFDDLRKTLNISNRSYSRSMKSISGEHFSEGKSGSFFFFSGDKRYMVKSITIEEFKCLSRILPALNTYLTSEPRSFLARLLGAHSITIYNKQIYFVVMTNSLYTGSGRNSLKIHERYDLKGAWDNRNVRPLEPGTRAKCIHCNLPFVVGETRSVIGKAAQCPERPTGRDHEPSRLFLDNDLNRKVTLQVDLASRVKEQLTRDSQFLESQGLLDYSMLLGVHRRRCLLTSESLLMIPRSAVKTQFKHRSWNNLRNAAQQQPHQVLESKEDDDDDDDDDDHNHTNGQKTLPITIPLRKEETTSTPMQALRNSNARQSRHCRFGEHTLQAAWVEGPALYWISIIDILQEWTWKKRLERIFKMIFRCKQSDGFCAVPPDEYGRRFRIRIVDGAFESADVATTSSSSFGGGDIPLHPVDEKEEEGIDNNDDGNSIPPSPPSSPLR